MANWSSLSVKSIITKIKDDEVVLPVIQRRLVWTEDKMELLFDSLLKGNSFGSIICIEEEKSSKPLFAFRKFTSDGNDVSSVEVTELSKTQWFIIDGQQRLQSFYIGLIGALNGKRLFYDLYSDADENEYDFRFAVREEDLPEMNKERSPISDCLWYPVNDLYNRLATTAKERQVSAELLQKFAITDTAKKECIEIAVRDFYDAVFSDERIGISKVPVNKSRDEIENRQGIVELFRRLNDGGTKLSSYDLVASMFKGFDYKMERFLDTVVAENSDIGIDQDMLIKLLLILNDKPSKEMSELADEDAKFATTNFERIQETLKALKKFLKVTSMYNWFSGSKNRSAIPLYFLAYGIFYSSTETTAIDSIFNTFDTKDENCHLMAVWLRLSLLNKVFSRGCGWIPYKTGIRKIHAIMQENKGKLFPCDELFLVYEKHPLHFSDSITERNLNDLEHEFIFYLIYNGQPAIRNEDIDHIHPRSLLEKLKIRTEKINGIANYQRLDSGTNRDIKKGKELYNWLEKDVKETNKAGYINRHFIPNNPLLWKATAFDEFYTARSALLIKKIQEQLS